MLFGAKSEKLVRQVAQLELQLEELETSRGEEEVSAHLPFPIETEQEPKQSSRRTLPEHLPRETEMHRPETSCCPGCGGTLREFGEDVSEVLEYVPESFKVTPHVRPKFSCGRCETVVEASAPSRPIARSFAPHAGLGRRPTRVSLARIQPGRPMQNGQVKLSRVAARRMSQC